MSKGLLEIIGILLLGLPIGLITIRYFFKKSILFSITAYWIFTLTLYSALANLKWVYPETFPPYITLPIGIIVVIFIFRHVAKKILQPLLESIDNIKKFSEVDLTVVANKIYSMSNDELG